MSDFVDPFASAPADEAQATPEPEAPAETVFDTPPAEAPPAPAAPAKKAPAKKAAAKAAPAPVQVGSDGKVVLTLKGGTGFDAPWIVIHATDLQDAHEQISGENGALLAQIMERTQIAAQHFAKLGGGSSAPAQRPQRQAAPAAAQQPPAGSPAAPGPDWVYKTGVSKSGPNAGQTWQAWMPPQHLKDVEKPVWF